MVSSKVLRRCAKCVMPDTRPGSVFDEQGVCLACLNYEKRTQVDWAKRYQQLEGLCDSYKRKDGYYDCAIGVSGGKDSHFILYTLKRQMGMNPLLITVADPFTKTEAGEYNLKNLIEVFECDHIMFTINTDFAKEITRYGFEEWGEPLRFIETAIYVTPIRIAQQMGIPLVFYGENPDYDYGELSNEVPSVIPHMKKMVDRLDLSNRFFPELMNSLKLPDGDIDVRYLGHYVPWSSVKNLEIANRYGFRDLVHEWIREGCSDNFEQIDSLGYMVNIWLKYPKFGFQRVSDVESRRIREGLQTHEEAMKLVEEFDHKLDRKALDDFCSVLGYTHKEFWEIVDRWNKYL